MSDVSGLDTGDLLRILMCPQCGASPDATLTSCPKCGRYLLASGGGLDLLADDSRVAADQFAGDYRELRVKEGWADASGREDPEGGNEALWRSRSKSASRALGILGRELNATTRPVVADVGSGGGWAAQRFIDADVVAIDLLDVPARRGSITVRGDMRNLPLRDGTLDAALYAASLHYAPVAIAIREAARVLRGGGLLVAVDSPIYPDARSRARALARSTAYYTHAGFPQLASHYQPIEAGALRSALLESGFTVVRLDLNRGLARVCPGFARRPPSSLVVARRSQ